MPPAHPAYNPMFTQFAERLEEKTNGELRGNLLGTEVANIGNMRNAIRSGLVEAGLFLPAYFPADLPEINLVGDMAFLGTTPHAMAAAVMEYIVTCAECQEELKALGIVYTSSHASDLYRILSTKPVRSSPICVACACASAARSTRAGPSRSASHRRPCRWVKPMSRSPRA